MYLPYDRIDERECLNPRRPGRQSRCLQPEGIADQDRLFTIASYLLINKSSAADAVLKAYLLEILFSRLFIWRIDYGPDTCTALQVQVYLLPPPFVWIVLGHSLVHFAEDEIDIFAKAHYPKQLFWLHLSLRGRH